MQKQLNHIFIKLDSIFDPKIKDIINNIFWGKCIHIIENPIHTILHKNSLTFYYLNWLKVQIESNPSSDITIRELLYKTIHSFPYPKQQEESIEDLLERSDLEFESNLSKLTNKYLENKQLKTDMIIMLVDGFPKEPRELYSFLGLPNFSAVVVYNNLSEEYEYLFKEILNDNNTK